MCNVGTILLNIPIPRDSQLISSCHAAMVSGMAPISHFTHMFLLNQAMDPSHLTWTDSRNKYSILCGGIMNDLKKINSSKFSMGICINYTGLRKARTDSLVIL